MRIPVSILTAAVAFGSLTAVSQAAVLYNETSGDLSNSQAAPNAFNLTTGVNSVIGSVGTGDSQDWIALTVPAGTHLRSLTLFSYNSTDAQGFMGVQSGAAFVGSTGDPASYLGYVHYGTGATNGALPPTNVVGTNLLPLMGNTSLAFGSQGFTPPLGAGTYTFLIQQLGAPTSYQFDFAVTAVPEPASLAILAFGSLSMLARRGRRLNH